MLALREVRAIYHQGVYAVAAAFRQLYEMIEVEDERVYRLVAAANAAHLRKIEQLTARIHRIEEELAGIMFAVWKDGTEFDPRLLRRGDRAAVT